MKKTLLTTLLSAGISISGMAMEIANVRVTAVPVGDTFQTQKRMPYSLTTADLLVNENFEACTLGTLDEPDFDNPMAHMDTNIEINPALTHGEQWYGHKIYEAGGAIAMQTLSMDQCILNTPRMDYSGSVRLSFITRALKSTWLDESGEERWDNSAHLIVGISEEQGRPVETNAKGNLADLQLYADMGWMEVTIEFDNYSAYCNASIVFAGIRTLLIDDIKVTSSCDEFIAAPVITGVTDVTETSFTIHWEKMRKSYNYYIWLYADKGINPESGEEMYEVVIPRETIEWLQACGISVEEYIESQGGQHSPYLKYDIVDRYGDMSYTFTNLDPSTDYCFAVMSHNVFKFSEKKLVKVTDIATPVPLEASDITKTSFTANWTGIKKADSYNVNLYGVTIVDHSDPNYEIFREDFDKTSQYSSSTDIYEPTPCTASMTLDDVTSTTGWEINGPLALEMPEGEEKPTAYMLDGWFGPGMNLTLSTPMIYVGNNDYAIVSLHVKCENPVAPIIMQFAGGMYMADMGGNNDATAVMSLPTNGFEQTKLELACMDQQGLPLFIDYISVSQPLEKGDMLFSMLGTTQVAAEETSLVFNGIDKLPYKVFAYSVTALKNDGRMSAESERALVEHSKIANVADIVNAGVNELKEVARYTADGRQINAPVPGINIIRYNDGSTRKVFVK